MLRIGTGGTGFSRSGLWIREGFGKSHPISGRRGENRKKSQNLLSLTILLKGTNACPTKRICLIELIGKKLHQHPHPTCFSCLDVKAFFIGTFLIEYFVTNCRFTKVHGLWIKSWTMRPRCYWYDIVSSARFATEFPAIFFCSGARRAKMSPKIWPFPFWPLS